MKMSAYALVALMTLPGAAVMAETAPAATPAATPAAAPAKAKHVKAAKAVKPAAEMKVRGTVSSVDAVAGTITVKAKKGEETISVPSTVSIHSGKAEVKLADIAAGSRVAVTYKNEDGKPVASAVRVMPMAAKKAAPATKG